MSYSDQYTKVNNGNGWKNEVESHDTPLDAINLNHMDNGIKTNDSRITALENSSMGVGNSTTIEWDVVNNKNIPSIKENSIDDKYLEPNYLALLTTQADRANQGVSTAEAKATESESWAIGGTGTRTGEDTNNAKYWSEQARIGVTGNYVSYDEQTLTDEQKAQARANIGALSGSHTHTVSQITDFPTEMPPTAHNHDTSYYTKTQIDGMLGTQATWVLNGTTLTITTL